MPTIHTERLHFHYRSHGNAKGLPLLLLHGSYASSRWWEPLFEVLPEDVYCLAPDLRGCGESDKPDHDYTIEEQSEDIVAFVRAMRLRDFCLAAHSSSGAIAMEFVLNYPDLASSMILIDSVPIEGVFTPIDGLMLLEQLKSDSQLLARALSTLMPTLDTATDTLFPLLLADAQKMAPSAFTAIAESLNRWNRFADGKRLTLPTLLLWGEQDEIVSREATTRTLIALPGAGNLEVLQNCGHSPMLETPLPLAERIVEFLTDDYAQFNAIRNTAYE